MNFFQFMFTKTFWVQMLLAVILVVVLCFGYLFWLDWHTNHGQQITVPDLTRKSLSEADDILEEMDLRRHIIDSASFNPDFPPRSVIEQNPKAGLYVKENRQIYIKLNPSGYGKVLVPNVVFKTKRQAIPTLEALGFKIGDITYKQNIATDMVLELRHNGENLESGTQLRKASTVDLVLGDGKRLGQEYEEESEESELENSESDQEAVEDDA
ncbi:PASTA domain-containing protein [Nonlabens sp. Hel1_33_55]|uniref:PASTA domain-containing protein n=1 Tax=Nonlabens sp. Hel1_33_55 TaxID=1336802 RepID=UPI000875E084|nr:PASTA domain-containing protein [Nonlabens sp. Hel1_33_55]SCY22244.1 PASTA domain-containing protein [Nonlabens sp. Hel1_33_55]